MTRIVERHNRVFSITGKFGNFSVYHNGYCVAFGLMTANDAENWIWSRYTK